MNDKQNQIHKSTLNKEDTITSDHIGKLMIKFLMQTVNFINLIALQIELRGKCEQYQYTLDPPAINFPSKFYQHSTFRKGFRVITLYNINFVLNIKHFTNS